MAEHMHKVGMKHSNLKLLTDFYIAILRVTTSGERSLSHSVVTSPTLHVATT